jgi:hypothetical protein
MAKQKKRYSEPTVAVFSPQPHGTGTSHMFSWENNGGFSIASLDYRMVIHTKSQEVHFLTSWNQPATNLMLICHLPSGHDYISRYHQISTNPVKSTSD